jgi:hypothetical protein
MKHCRYSSAGVVVGMACAALVVVLPADFAGATDYYVATNGLNGNAGTDVDHPLLTIQQAANLAQAGDTVYVRGGTYRETVTMSRSGNASAPINFRPYGAEQVTISGLDQVTSGWTNYSGSTYSTSVSADPNQVFVNGKMMTAARWGNGSAAFSNPLRATTSNVASATQGTGNSWTITDSALAGTGNWVGAKIAMVSGLQWVTYSATVTAQGTNSLTFNGGWDYPPTAGNQYYLYQSLNALNAPREWYYNASTSKLYLQAPGGVNPSTQTVEVRKRQDGFALGSQSHINVSGFRLLGAGVNIAAGGSFNTINNCQVLYPAPFQDPNAWAGSPDGILIAGQHNTVSRSEIGYSWGSGVTVTGDDNTVDNNIIHDCGLSGNEKTLVNVTGQNTTVSNNTMYNAGRSGVVLRDPSSTTHPVTGTRMLHNDISRFGYLTKDLGGIYTYSADLAGTVIAYNRIHDSHTTGIAAGVYLDSNCSNATVHHNLVYNVQRGMIMNPTATNEDTYNNTFWVDAYAMSPGGGSGCVNCSTYNNLSNRSSGWTGNNVGNNATTSDQFVNSATGNFQLKSGSSAINYGRVVPGITDGYTGSAPDAGAFEYGTPGWTAGADWKAWTFGNQVATPLTTAMYVTQGNTQVTTGSLMVGNVSSTGNNSRTFLKFDLSGLTQAVGSAVLQIYENATLTSSNGDIMVRRVTSAWTPANVTFNQSLTDDGAQSGFYDSANLDLYTDVDVTSIVRYWLDHPTENFGLCLTGTESQVGTAKYLEGFYGVSTPQLVITYVPEPASLGLLGPAAVAGLGIWAWRKRRIAWSGDARPPDLR